VIIQESVKLAKLEEILASGGIARKTDVVDEESGLVDHIEA